MIGEAKAFAGQTVQVGSFNVVASITAQVPVAEIIGHDQYDVWWPVAWSARFARSGIGGKQGGRGDNEAKQGRPCGNQVRQPGPK
jgi:hypothetical protein